MKTQAGTISTNLPDVPLYLSETYWWAYVHPHAIRLFERQWLVNLILWGNFGPLRDAALDALGLDSPGKTLQVACVYGDLTTTLLKRADPGASLDVIDVLPLQLANLTRKLPAQSDARLIHCDSAAMAFDSGSYDRALLFFLLHEQPEEVRKATLMETLRVVKPGGRIVIVDYHRPSLLNPLHVPMIGILRTLEPFALDLWRREITDWFPAGVKVAEVRKTTSFGGLYQMLIITV
ncbi:MAG: rhodoquinone biosynthesis methyltransferase RquA [Burkholderiales bacterium]